MNHRNEMSQDELERKLRAYLREEASDLRLAQDFWARIEPRLEEPPRQPSVLARLALGLRRHTLATAFAGLVVALLAGGITTLALLDHGGAGFEQLASQGPQGPQGPSGPSAPSGLYNDGLGLSEQRPWAVATPVAGRTATPVPTMAPQGTTVPTRVPMPTAAPAGATAPPAPTATAELFAPDSGYGLPIPSPPPLPTFRTLTRNGELYRAASRQIPESRLQTDKLVSTDLMVNQVQHTAVQGGSGDPVFQVPGVPLKDGFLVKIAAHSCASGFASGELYVYTAEGQTPPPPPYSFPSPTPPPAKATVPTPTPAPWRVATPTPVPLTAQGLADAGWPDVQLEEIAPEYDGTTYRYTGFADIGASTVNGTVERSDLHPIETLQVPVANDAPIPSMLDSIVRGGTTTEPVRIDRVRNNPVSQVIAIEPCPADKLGSAYVLYKTAPPPTPTPTQVPPGSPTPTSTGVPNPVAAATATPTFPPPTSTAVATATPAK